MAGHFRKRTLSMRGDPVDFEALSLQNAKQVALGNARMNAKGDRLGEGGVVLKTQEQIEAEWAAARAKVKNANIKDPNMLATPKVKADRPAAPADAPTAPAVTDGVEFPTIQDLVSSGAMPQTSPKRKIVDRDD